MPTKAKPGPAPKASAFPELEAAMRVLVRVPKSEVDAAIKKERTRKQRRKRT
jgi:hypothetical protein